MDASLSQQSRLTNADAEVLLSAIARTDPGAGYDNTLVSGWVLLQHLGIGLVTDEQRPLENGTATLTSPPLGGIVLNQAYVHLSDGTVVEVVGVTLDPETPSVSLTGADVEAMPATPVSVTVSYLGRSPQLTG